MGSGNSAVKQANKRLQMGRQFPIELAIQLVAMSNALLHLAYRLLANLGGGIRMNDVTKLYRQFSDCLPTVKTGDTGHVV